MWANRPIGSRLVPGIRVGQWLPRHPVLQDPSVHMCGTKRRVWGAVTWVGNRSMMSVAPGYTTVAQVKLQREHRHRGRLTLEKAVPCSYRALLAEQQRKSMPSKSLASKPP